MKLRSIHAWLVAFAFLAHILSANALSASATFEDRCHQEVVRLHEMIEAWLAGSIPDSDEAYRRFSAAMADDFEIISPSGARSDRAGIVSSFRNAHGTRDAQFLVAIKNVKTRLLRSPLALLTYEEWQFDNGKATARLSTVLLRQDSSTPGGVAWVHLHETWLPEPELSPTAND